MMIKNQTKFFVCFSNKETKNELNRYKLYKTHGSDNPVAKIQSVTKSRTGILVINNAHYDIERTPPTTLLCVKAKLSLTRINIKPSIGLFHGALGTVLDIVYHDWESPSPGVMDAYILVDFPQYKGQPIISEKPTIVPICPIEINCKKNCCIQKYIPLTLAYGKTAHTFQGQTSGPVNDPNKPKTWYKGSL